MNFVVCTKLDCSNGAMNTKSVYSVVGRGKDKLLTKAYVLQQEQDNQYSFGLTNISMKIFKLTINNPLSNYNFLKISN